MATIKNTVLRERRIGVPDAKQNIWIRHKDVLVLFFGALLGILSSAFAVSQQAHFQRSQAFAEKRFTVLREIVEVNNEIWRKNDANLRAAEGILSNLSSKIDSIEEKKVRGFLIGFPVEFGKELDPVSKALNDDARQYDSKMETLTTLLAYLTNQDPDKLKIDLEFKSFDGRADVITIGFRESLKKSATDIEIKAAVKKYIDDFEKLSKDIRESIKADRSRVNLEIRKIARSVLEI